MSESDLSLPTIVPLLQPKAGTTSKPEADSRPQPASSQSNASIAQHPHLVPASLKVETVLLTKELAKFRACDQSTCFYCREWAQWVFKKTFGKDKDKDKEKGSSAADKKGGRASGSSAGGSGNAAGTGSEPKKKHKEYAMVVCERFYQRSTADTTANGSHGRHHPGAVSGAESVAAAAIAASKAGTGTGPAPSFTGVGHEGFVSEIVDTVREWIQQPSALYTSPEVFSLIDFEALYAAYPLLNQEQNQQQDDVTPILSTITIEKAHMILGHQGYPLLKRVTKAQLQNQIMNPTCQHMKGHSKNPADLELEKDVFNEELKKMRMRDQEGLRKQIGPVWKHVEEALERMEGAEKVRSEILGPSRAKEFVQTYKDQLASFQEIWTNVDTAAKKSSSRKKGATPESIPGDPVEEVDRGFQQFIDNMQYIHKQLIADVLESSERSLREFIKELAGAQTKILKLALTRIQEGKVGTARIDKILEESPEKCRNALKMVEQLIPIFDTKMGQFRVLVLNKLKEVDEEIESVATAYFQDSQKTVQGRLEKAANKDFRKRIKKLEFLSVETRKWFFQSRLTLFSSLDFATVCLNTLGILMEEAEVLEAVQLGLHDDHFRSRVLKSQEGRVKLAQQFREGVKTGRRVLAVMVSRLMMREGARAMGEMAAIQKEKKFLKSIGQEVDDTKLSSKGFLIPNQDVTTSSNAQVSDDEDGDDAPGTASVSKNKKKKDKKKKKKAEAAAAAASEVTPDGDPGDAEDGSLDATMNSGAVSGLIRNTLAEPLTALSSKEAREQKKLAKKEAKRQTKEAAEAEEAAAAAIEAKKAQEEQRVKEMNDALEAIKRQEAKELKEKEKAELARQKKAAEEAREAEAARVRKAAEEEEARRKAQEDKELIEAMEKERAQREAEEAKKARDAANAQRARENQQSKNKTKDTPKPKESQAKAKGAATKDNAQKPKETQGVKGVQDVKETTTTTPPSVIPESTPSTATGWDAAPTPVTESTDSSTGWDAKPTTTSMNWEEKRSAVLSESKTPTTGAEEKPKSERAPSAWDEKLVITSSEQTSTTTGWDSKPTTSAAGWSDKPKVTPSEWTSTTKPWDEKPKAPSSEQVPSTAGWDEKPKEISPTWTSKTATTETTSWGEQPEATSTSWAKVAATPSAWTSKTATSSEEKPATTSSGWAAPATERTGWDDRLTPSAWASSATEATETTGWEDKPAAATKSTGWGDKPTTTTESTGWSEKPATTKSTGRDEKAATTTSTGWDEKPAATPSTWSSSTTATMESTNWGEKKSTSWEEKPAATKSTGWEEKPAATKSTSWDEKPATVTKSTGWDEKPAATKSTGWDEKPAASSSTWTSSTTATTESTGWDEKPAVTPSEQTLTTETTGWGEKPTTASTWTSSTTVTETTESVGWGEKSATVQSEWTSSGWDSAPATTTSEWNSSTETTGWGEKSAQVSSEWSSSTGQDSTGPSAWTANDSRVPAWGSSNRGARGGRGMDRGQQGPRKRFSEDRGQRGPKWGESNDYKGRYNNEGPTQNEYRGRYNNEGSTQSEYRGRYNNEGSTQNEYRGRYNNEGPTQNEYKGRYNNEAPAQREWRNSTQNKPSYNQRDGDQSSVTEASQEDSGLDSVEDLARLPVQTLVSLVHTLQVENKSLLTTLVSMQQQVSSLTERYSTLASLAREHEQQAIQAMESQKQREMEEVQRYVWKVEERCRQLEKYVLATQQHRMQHMQQQQQQQQQQQFQQQQPSVVSGPPGISVVGNAAIPPPGFNNVLGMGRQLSAPTSPSLGQRNVNGLDSPTSPSFSMVSGSPSIVFPNMMSSANGSMESLMSPVQGGLINIPVVSSAPASAGGVPPGYESASKKSHWRQRVEVRCGNCAETGHAITDCPKGCRYCDKEGHLSQDCPSMTATDA